MLQGQLYHAHLVDHALLVEANVVGAVADAAHALASEVGGTDRVDVSGRGVGVAVSTWREGETARPKQPPEH